MVAIFAYCDLKDWKFQCNYAVVCMNSCLVL